MTDPTPTPAAKPPWPLSTREPAEPEVEGRQGDPSSARVAGSASPVSASTPIPASALDADSASASAPEPDQTSAPEADPVPTPDTDPIPAPGVAPAPAPAPDPDTAPDPDVAPDPETAPAPAPAPDSVPEPNPDPDPVTDPSPSAGFEGDPTAWPPDEAFEAVELDDRGWTRRDLEAILLVADEPVPAPVLAEIVGSRLSEVEELLVDLAGEYARDGRGFVLRAVAGGWRLYSNPGARTAVEAFLRAGQQSRLTRAALETLAVIAYRQPVTRFQVAAVRGVNVDGVFRTLASRGLIHEVGTDPGPGQATLYGTTPAFLEQLGLNDLDQLPPIKDYLPEGVELLDLQEQP
jgi:segregation and condensation protein B